MTASGYGIDRRFPFGYALIAYIILIVTAAFRLTDVYLGRAIALIPIWCVLALLPSSLAMLALTRNPLRAADPRLLVDAMIRMRGDYMRASRLHTTAALRIARGGRETVRDRLSVMRTVTQCG